MLYITLVMGATNILLNYWFITDLTLVKAPGPSGVTSVMATDKTTTSVLSMISKPSCVTSWSSGSAKRERPVSLSKLAQWRMPSWQWTWGSPTRVSQIPESRLVEGPPTCSFSPEALHKDDDSASRPMSQSSGPASMSSTATIRLKGKPTDMLSTSSSLRSSGCCDQPSTSRPQEKPPHTRRPLSSKTLSSSSTTTALSPA